MNHRKILFVVVGMIGAAALAACGTSSASGNSGATTKPTTATTSTAPLGQQVATILDSVSSQTENLELSADWVQLGAAYGKAAKQLQALTFSASSKADAKKLIAVLDQVNVDAGQVPTDGTANLLTDLASASTAGNALRSALGLPPVTTTT